MSLLSVKIFITFSMKVNDVLNGSTVDIIVALVTLYYTIKKERRVEGEREEQKQTVTK